MATAEDSYSELAVTGAESVPAVQNRAENGTHHVHQKEELKPSPDAFLRGGKGKRPWPFWKPILLALFAVVITLTFPRLVAPPRTSEQDANVETCSCQVPRLSGVVNDCCCEYEVVDSLNRDVLHPVLKQLVTKPFFRYFKVRLWCDCPFWPDDGMCHLRDCSVCECSEDEFPEPLRHRQQEKGLLAPDNPQCHEEHQLSAVDRTLEQAEFRQWTETDNPWTYDDEADGGDLTYVNLLLNPERYTGYKGQSAKRIWQGIYAESCFEEGPDTPCTEKRVLYRLISGLHTSITVHIAANFLLDDEKQLWGPNLELFRDRVLISSAYRQNLYFTYLFVLRAATKAADYLSQASYDTGNPEEDKETLELVRQLVGSERLRAACPVPFDEGQMWKGEEGPALRKELQNHFRNISALIDCVGCEKCRLWGKLQILGLGTALKILFSVDEPDGSHTPLLLQRNEVSALINVLARLAESLDSVSDLTALVEEVLGAQSLRFGGSAAAGDAATPALTENASVGGPLPHSLSS